MGLVVCMFFLLCQSPHLSQYRVHLTSLFERILSVFSLPASHFFFFFVIAQLYNGCFFIIIQYLLFPIGYIDFECKDIYDNGVSIFYL